MKSIADVVIIGAGAIGCSTAYHLAQAGITDVVVIEMDQVGSGTSGKSASMLTLQFFHDELTLRMAKYSYDCYMQFEEEIGAPIDFKRIGFLSLATEKTAEPLRRNAEMLQFHDVPTSLLNPEEIKAFYPEINTEDLILGTGGAGRWLFRSSYDHVGVYEKGIRDGCPVGTRGEGKGDRHPKRSSGRYLH